MKRNLILLSAATVLLSAAAAADDKSARKEVDAAYRKLEAAIKAKNIDGVLKLSTLDFTMKQPGKKPQNAEQVKAAMMQEFAMAKSVDEVKMTVTKFTVTGYTAEATTSGKMSLSMYGQQGKTNKLVDLSTTKDTWVKGADGWKIKSVDVITDKMTLDGKPFDPSAAMAGMSGGGAKRKK